MKERILLITFLVVSLLLLTLTTRGVIGNPTVQSIGGELNQGAKPYESSQERGRYLLIISLAENRSFGFSEEYAEVALPDVGYYKGQFYVFWPPGISLILLPSYLIGKQFGLAQFAVYFTISLFALASMYFVYKIARNMFKLPQWASLAGMLMYGFATTGWSYAVTLNQHQITTFFILTAFYSIWKYRHVTGTKWMYAAYAWAVYGIGVWIDYANVVLLMPLLAYLFLGSFTIKADDKEIEASMEPSFLITSIICILILAGHLYYNYVNFGGITHLSGGIVSYNTIKKEKLFSKKNPEKAIDDLAKKKNVTKFFTEDNVPTHFYTLSVADDKGIFFFSPILLLGVGGILLILSAITLDIGALLSLLILNFFFYSSWGDPWGGWAYGPRYLIPSMAILSIFSAVFLARFKYKLIAKIIAFVLLTYSSAIALLGAITTNIVPPKVEATFLKLPYHNYLLNWEFLLNNKTSSFVYSNFLSSSITLLQYYIYIYFILMVIWYITLFVLPFFDKKHTSKISISSKRI